MRARQRAADLDPVWRALANPIRRQMLDVLHDGPSTTGQLAGRFPDLSRFAVMQHLRVLASGELVTHRRRGRERFNYINPIPIRQIFNRWVSRYQGPWLEALVGLKEGLEMTHAAGAGAHDARGPRRRTRSTA